MPKVRYTFGGQLTVETALHVGSGADREATTRVRGKAGDNSSGPPRVAAIVRDYETNPYIPATTLKGLLRRLAEARFDANDVVGLFGEIKKDGRGQMGALLFRGATWRRPGDAGLLPYADPLGTRDLGPGVFVAARTSIDRGSGTADDGLLYFQEMVAPGSSFNFEVILEAPNETAGQARAHQVLELLGALKHDGGQIGKGQADGQGLIKLDVSETDIKAQRIGAVQGAFADDAAARALLQIPREAKAVTSAKHGDFWKKTFTLKCDGPFMVLDSSYEPRRNPATNDPSGPQLKTQRISDTLPLILGSSVTGALRARARWLLAREALRQGKVAPSDDTGKSIKWPTDIKTLSPVERLFGVTGFRGLLQVRALQLDDKSVLYPITSVKLDRFSGGPIDGALFESQTFINVRAMVTLAIEKRGGVASTADAELAEKLFEDIKKNGLDLGHGSNKGFGWFEVEEGAQ